MTHTQTLGAVSLYVGVMFVFVVMDAMAKWIIEVHPIAQIGWLRYSIAALIYAVVAIARRQSFSLQPRVLRWQIVRGVCLVAATMLFYAGLRYIPLGDAITLVLTAPLTVALLSAVVLGEAVSRAAWITIIVGFAGAMLIIRPGLNIAHWGAMLPLLAGAAFAGLQLVSRHLSQLGAVDWTLFVTAGVGAVLMAAPALSSWQAPTLLALGLMIAIGLLAAMGDALLLRAFELAPAARLAPYQYTQLVWAVMLGYFVFGDVPDTLTLAGAALIAAAGLYLLTGSRAK